VKLVLSILLAVVLTHPPVQRNSHEATVPQTIVFAYNFLELLWGLFSVG
jgi:hypothetical protein